MNRERPRLLDLFCCAGGAGMGYHRAGFEVVGVDNRPQPRYPFEFHQADALEYLAEHGQEFHAIHASPPCQQHCRMRKLTIAQSKAKNYPDLIEQTRRCLIASERPYVLENVEGAPLLCPIVLCGSMFGLDVQRHRLFECSFGLLGPSCNHRVWKLARPPLHRLQGTSRVVGCYGNGRGKGDTVALWRTAMGIDWMTRPELSQAIPPAYTEYIGKQLIRTLW
jgi:DNA (cytosine-5)-methyltransferase 1